MPSNDQTIQVVNIKNKLNQFSEYWNPKIVGELNDHKVQVAKLKGEFNWHHHNNEDELFIVIKGELTIHLADRDLVVHEGEFVIIPHPVEHKPEAKEEVHIVLIEPKTALNTGNVVTKNTRVKQDII